VFGKLEPRIWKPDETCRPFHFEASVVGADQVMGRFTIPRGMRAVIRMVGSQASSFQTKAAFRFLICKGRGDPTGELISRTVPLHGALANVEELNVGVNLPGFVASANAFSRPVCIELEGGSEYEIVKTSVTIAGQIILDGWLWPEQI